MNLVLCQFLFLGLADGVPNCRSFGSYRFNRRYGNHLPTPKLNVVKAVGIVALWLEDFFRVDSSLDVSRSRGQGDRLARRENGGSETDWARLGR